ncbi:MAG: HAD hydrolase-like protein [Saccharospirillaceae bacterium]|nr:HAD hydrolase-like protein [Pseudomonadales bacterium]NRB80728.1 HAD hydrolase-like protein [Saccharospirillaceae bacterium]
MTQLNSINPSNSAQNCVVIGDDYQNDILSSKKFGFQTALVKSGKYQLGQEKLCDPDWLINNLLDLDV